MGGVPPPLTGCPHFVKQTKSLLFYFLVLETIRLGDIVALETPTLTIVISPSPTAELSTPPVPTRAPAGAPPLCMRRLKHTTATSTAMLTRSDFLVLI